MRRDGGAPNCEAETKTVHARHVAVLEVRRVGPMR